MLICRIRLLPVVAAFVLALAGLQISGAGTARAGGGCTPPSTPITDPVTNEPGCSAGNGGSSGNPGKGGNVTMGVCENYPAVQKATDGWPCRKYNPSDVPWWYIENIRCYSTKIEPQPAQNDPLWIDGNGKRQWDGWQVEWVSCLTDSTQTPGTVPGPGITSITKKVHECGPGQCAKGTPGNPAVIQDILAIPVNIKMAPQAPTGQQTVAFVKQNVWFWTDTALVSAPASDGTGSGMITGQRSLDEITWTIKNGDVVVQTIHCTSAGTPYETRFAGQPSPDCGYTFTKSGSYTVSATAKWTITFTYANGQAPTQSNGIASTTNSTPITIIEGQSTNG